MDLDAQRQIDQLRRDRAVDRALLDDAATAMHELRQQHERDLREIAQLRTDNHDLKVLAGRS